MQPSNPSPTSATDTSPLKISASFQQSNTAGSSVRVLTHCLIVTAFAFVLIYTIFEPRWETNDDAAMSMVAHGYGIAAEASPNLIFSNVIWGHVVQALPSINGVLGYSIATVCALFLSLITVLHILRLLGVGVIPAIAATALIYFRPAIFPQFTLNSGLLTCAAVLALLLYSRTKKPLILLAACVLTFVAYLIRSQEVLLILAISAPLLPWRTLVKDRRFGWAACCTVVTVAGAALYDRHSFDNETWSKFKDINLARAPYTDFRAGDRLKAKKDIYLNHGFTPNDIELISEFFFVDPTIANPPVLTAMLLELGPLAPANSGLAQGLESLSTLGSAAALPSVIIALLLSLARPNWKIFAAWGLFAAAVFTFGLLGRIGILRVLLPVVALLCFMALVNLYDPQEHSKLIPFDARGRTVGLIIGSTLAIAAIINIAWAAPESKAASRAMAQTRKDIATFPNEMIVAWGGGIKIEEIYPVFGTDQKARSVRIFPFGVFTDAPFSVAHDENRKGTGFTRRLTSRNGILIVAVKDNIERLSRWCQERIHGELKTEIGLSTELIKIQRVACLK